MPLAASQGARIYYEETGKGTPILFIHEFGGDHRSWDDQMRHFGRSWRCITWAARGYPGSDAPDDETLYGQDFFNRDAIAVLDEAGIKQAHIVGLSMGGYTALMLAAKFPDRIISCVAAGAGSGALKSTRAQFIEEARVRAAEFDRVGRIDAEAMALSPTRVQLQAKDPIGWQHVRAQSGRAFCPAAAKTLAYSAGGAGVAVRHGRRAEGYQGAGAAAGGRRGRALPGRQPMDEATAAECAARVLAGLGPCHQSRGAGAVQPADRAVPGRRGAWQLAAARCTRAGGRDHEPAGWSA